MTTYTINEKLNGIEIKFDSKPAAEIRTTLKENGFRWHHKKALWYAKNTPERLTLAAALSNSKAPAKSEQAKVTTTTTNHSLKVGDILVASWGYEQTNVDFYQVVALKGKTMVTVKECFLEANETSYHTSMSRDISYNTGNAIIKEDAEPITRKVKNYTRDNDPAGDQIAIEDFIIAHKYNGETVYESWYA